MTFQLVCIEPKELTQYKADMQEAFQKGFEDAFGKTDAVILPEKDIDQSVNAEGSAVYKAVVDGEMVGGAVVIINESTQHNHLDLLFVKNGVQSNGIGKKIWFELERIYPNTKVWETCTPYFDKRNIHFYVNVCGFHITEFFNEKHPMPDTPDDFVGDGAISESAPDRGIRVRGFSLLGILTKFMPDDDFAQMVMNAFA